MYDERKTMLIVKSIRIRPAYLILTMVGFSVIFQNPFGGPVLSQESSGKRNYSGPEPTGLELSDLPVEAGQFRRLIARPRYFFFEDAKNLEICKAIEDHDLDSLKKLTKPGVDLNKQEKGGITVLYWAFMQDNPEAFEWLLEQGANPDLKLSYDKTLYPAFVGGFIVGKLRPPTYASGRESFYYSNESVLFAIVSRYGIRQKFLEPALKFTRDPNQRDDGTGGTLLHYFTYFHTATEEGIELLLKYGVDINATDKHGSTALLLFEGSPKFRLFLLEKGADPFVKDERGVDLLSIIVSDLKRDPKNNPYIPIKEFIEKKRITP